MTAVDTATRPWTLDAACRHHDPDLWFPPAGGVRQAQAAIAICRSCPVRAECRAEWLTLPRLQQRYGIWAGQPIGATP